MFLLKFNLILFIGSKSFRTTAGDKFVEHLKALNPVGAELSPTDNCKKMGLVFDDVVGIVEVINCRDVKVQVRQRRDATLFWIRGKLLTGPSLVFNVVAFHI